MADNNNEVFRIEYRMDVEGSDNFVAILRRVRDESSNINDEIQDDLQDTQNEANQTGNSFQGMADSLETIKNMEVTKFLVEVLKKAFEAVKYVVTNSITAVKEYDLTLRGLKENAKAYSQNGDEALKAAEALTEYTDSALNLKSAMVGIKNLLGTGMNVSQALDVSKALADVGAFNRVVDDFGQAFEESTKGIKTNSIELIENIGLTMKLSTAIEQQGVSTGKGIDLLNNAAQRQAFYNSMIAEGTKFQGNAKLMAQELAGAEAKLNAVKNDLFITIGQKLKPAYTELLKEMSEVLKTTKELIAGSTVEQIQKEQDELNTLAYRYEYLSKKQKLTAAEEVLREATFERMKQLYPEQFKNLTLEKDKYKETLNYIKSINSELNRKILIENNQEEIAKKKKEVKELTTELLISKALQIEAEKEYDKADKEHNKNRQKKLEIREQMAKKEIEFEDKINNLNNKIKNRKYEKNDFRQIMIDRDNLKKLKKEYEILQKERVKYEEDVFLKPMRTKSYEGDIIDHHNNKQKELKKQIQKINMELKKLGVENEEIIKKFSEPVDISRFKNMKSLTVKELDPIEVENEKKYQETLFNFRLSLITDKKEELRMKINALDEKIEAEKDNVKKLNLQTEMNKLKEEQSKIFEAEEDLDRKHTIALIELNKNELFAKKEKIKKLIEWNNQDLAKVQTDADKIKLETEKANLVKQYNEVIEAEEKEIKRKAQKRLDLQKKIEKNEKNNVYVDPMAYGKDTNYQENQTKSKLQSERDFLEQKKAIRREELEYTKQMNELIKQNEEEFNQKQFGEWNQVLGDNRTRLQEEMQLEYSRVGLYNTSYRTLNALMQNNIIAGKLSLKDIKNTLTQQLKAELMNKASKHAMVALSDTGYGLSMLAAQNYPIAKAAFYSAAQNTAIAAAFGLGASAINVNTSSSSDTSPEDDLKTSATEEATKENKTVKIHSDDVELMRRLFPAMNDLLNDGYTLKTN